MVGILKPVKNLFALSGGRDMYFHCLIFLSDVDGVAKFCVPLSFVHDTH